MTRLRNWLGQTFNILLLSAVVGGASVATPALAGPGHDHGDHRRDHDLRDRADSFRVIQQQRARIEQLVAERNGAWDQIEGLKRQITHLPTASQWASAQSRIASLEHQLVDRDRQLTTTRAQLAETSRQADRRAHYIERLQQQLAESEARVAHLERRLGYHARTGRRDRYGRRVASSD